MAYAKIYVLHINSPITELLCTEPEGDGEEDSSDDDSDTAKHSSETSI